MTLSSHDIGNTFLVVSSAVLWSGVASNLYTYARYGKTSLKTEPGAGFLKHTAAGTLLALAGVGVCCKYAPLRLSTTRDHPST